MPYTDWKYQTRLCIDRLYKGRIVTVLAVSGCALLTLVWAPNRYGDFIMSTSVTVLYLLASLCPHQSLNYLWSLRYVHVSHCTISGGYVMPTPVTVLFLVRTLSQEVCTSNTKNYIPCWWNKGLCQVCYRQRVFCLLWRIWIKVGTGRRRQFSREQANEALLELSKALVTNNPTVSTKQLICNVQ